MIPLIATGFIWEGKGMSREPEDLLENNVFALRGYSG
jgi:hypothetical protein